MDALKQIASHCTMSINYHCDYCLKEAALRFIFAVTQFDERAAEFEQSELEWNFCMLTLYLLGWDFFNN